MKLSESHEGLLLAASPGPGTDHAGEHLRAMAGPFNANNEYALLSPAEGAERLSQGRGTHLLVVYPDPAEALAEAMGAGCPPTQSLSRWRQQMEQVLEVCRRNRRNITLVNARVVLADATGLGQLLSLRIGMSLQPAPGEQHMGRDAEDPLMGLLAAYTLSNAPDVGSLINELAASSLSPEPARQTRDLVDSAYEAMISLNESDDIEALKSTLDFKEKESLALREERDLLLEQVLKIQKRMEIDVIESEEKRLSHESAISEQKHRNQRMEKELSEMSNRCECLGNELKEKNEKIVLLNRERNKLKESLNQIRGSRSWKLTAPLRVGTRSTRKKPGEQA